MKHTLFQVIKIGRKDLIKILNHCIHMGELGCLKNFLNLEIKLQEGNINSIRGSLIKKIIFRA